LVYSYSSRNKSHTLEGRGEGVTAVKCGPSHLVFPSTPAASVVQTPKIKPKQFGGWIFGGPFRQTLKCIYIQERFLTLSIVARFSCDTELGRSTSTEFFFRISSCLSYSSTHGVSHCCPPLA